jgi:hypothetical protein
MCMNMARNVIYLPTSMTDQHTAPNLCSVVLDMKHAHNLQSMFSFHALWVKHTTSTYLVWVSTYTLQARCCPGHLPLHVVPLMSVNSWALRVISDIQQMRPNSPCSTVFCHGIYLILSFQLVWLYCIVSSILGRTVVSKTIIKIRWLGPCRVLLR